jgi:hypothetical protein
VAAAAWLVTGALVWYQWGHPGAGIRGMLLMTAASVSTIGAVVGWRNSPIGRLHWDGTQWFWTGAETVLLHPIKQVFIAIDLQSLVLVQLRSETAGSRWIFMQAGVNRAQWLALRRALVSAGAARAPVKPDQGASADDDLLGANS